MNYLHMVVSYIILHRAFGHATTALFYEISKYLLYISYCGVCLTLTTSYNYLFKQTNNQIEYKSIQPEFDNIDFEIDEEDYIFIENIKKK